MNWKKAGYIFLLAFIVFVLNGASIAWLVMNFYGDTNVILDIAGAHRELNVAFWDTLSYKYKAITYALMVFGGFGSFGFIKLFYKNNRQTKQRKEDQQLAKAQTDAFTKTIEKIIEGKK